MAKFSKNNFRLIIEEIEDSESYGENIWIAVGILEIMYDDYAGILDRYFHLEKKDRNIDKLWDEINKISVGTLSVPTPKKEGSWWFYDGKPYIVPTGPCDPVYLKITWTCDDNLSNVSTRATLANTIPPKEDNE